MIDLFLAGTQCKEAEDIIEQNGYCRLFSYFNDKKKLRDRFSNNIKGKLFVDSGAFTAWTKGVSIDVDEYIEWLNANKEHIYLAGQLDVIPGKFRQNPTKEEVEHAAQKTCENYWYMRERLDNPDMLVYTFHYGEDFKFLEEMLTHPEIKYIALGGMVGRTMDAKENFCQKCFSIIKKSPNQDVKVHAFGMTSLSLLQKFPFTSADSTAWIMTGMTGRIFSKKYGMIDVSQNNKYEKDNIFNLPNYVIEEVEQEISELGYTLKELEENYKARMCYNVKYLNKLSQTIECKTSLVRKGLF